MEQQNTGGIWQGDVIIKALIDLGLDEMRKNPWLLDHVFQSLNVTRYIADQYGKSNIDAAKEWFANNRINVYMRPRDEDKDQTPMVTILPMSSNEKVDMKTLGDMSTMRKILKPLEIGKPIPYIVNPVAPTGYDQTNGFVIVPSNTPGIGTVVPNQVLVNPDNGTGYIILGVLPFDRENFAIEIQPGTPFSATKVGVVPEFQFYETRVENTFMQETYSIGCYAHGNPQNLLWLHSIVLYSMFRYRQTLLEGSGFAESVITSGEIGEDPNFQGPGGEKCFTRFITLSGQVQNTWLKAPQRYIEAVTGDIEILSNLNAPPQIMDENPSWDTIEDTDED